MFTLPRTPPSLPCCRLSSSSGTASLPPISPQCPASTRRPARCPTSSPTTFPTTCRPRRELISQSLCSRKSSGRPPTAPRWCVLCGLCGGSSMYSCPPRSCDGDNNSIARHLRVLKTELFRSHYPFRRSSLYFPFSSYYSFPICPPGFPFSLPLILPHILPPILYPVL